MPVLTSYQLTAPYSAEWHGPGTLAVVNEDDAAAIVVSVHTTDGGEDINLQHTGDAFSCDLENVTDFRITASQYPATITLVVTPLAVTVSPAPTVGLEPGTSIVLGAGSSVTISGTPTVNIAAGQVVQVQNVSGGSLTVAGSVNVANTPAVSISGTPTVNIAAGQVVQVQNVSGGSLTVAGSVNVANTPAVTISGTPTVAIAANQNVNIANTPAVTISGTPTVAIAANQNVNIANTPAVTISGTPSVSVSAGTVNVQNVTGNILNAAGITRYAGAITASATQTIYSLSVTPQPNDSSIVVMPPIFNLGDSATIRLFGASGAVYGVKWTEEAELPIIFPISPGAETSYTVQVIVTIGTGLPYTFRVLVDTEPLAVRVTDAALRAVAVPIQIRGAGGAAAAGTITVGSLPAPGTYGQVWSCTRAELSIATNGTSLGAIMGRCILYVYDGTTSYYLAQAVIEEGHVTHVEVTPAAPILPGLNGGVQWTVYLVIVNIVGTGSYDWAVTTDWIPQA